MGINLLSVGICITHTIVNCAIAGHTKYTAVIIATRRAPPEGIRDSPLVVDDVATRDNIVRNVENSTDRRELRP